MVSHEQKESYLVLTRSLNSVNTSHDILHCVVQQKLNLSTEEVCVKSSLTASVGIKEGKQQLGADNQILLII